jgi:hypothetical protein
MSDSRSFGIRNQCSVHINNWCSIKESNNVFIKTICEADERLFASRSKTITDKTGVKPGTEWDMRKVFDDKDIHAVSIVTPDHWHALATIWACQAGSVRLNKNEHPVSIYSTGGVYGFSKDDKKTPGVMS